MRPEEVTRVIHAEFGANASYVEELLRHYQQSPRSVGDEWARFFGDLLNGADTSAQATTTNGASVQTNGSALAVAPATNGAAVVAQAANGVTAATNRASAAMPEAPSATAPASSATTTTASGDAPEHGERVAIRGTALKIVENMDASLTVPTATSVRQVQIKLLDENRRWVNRHMEAEAKGKTSYTHFIAWAMLKALQKYPQLNDGFAEIDGVAHRIKRADVNLGLAVDVQKKDGSRSLFVPNIKAANRLNFLEFYNAYQRVVLAARDNKLTVADFQGTTISLTNPGTLGTSASNPRLMAGQGVIIASGAIEYPPEYAAMTDEALSQLGISKVLTLTSTYDHRIIQGAESGAFLAYVHELLMGNHRFYDEIFADLGIFYKPLRWAKDVNPMLFGIDRARAEVKKEARLFELINAYRVRGHLIADTDPLNMIPLHEHPELEIENYGLSIWDLDREFYTSGLGNQERATLREIWAMLLRYYSGKVGIESRHITSKEQKDWLRARIETDPPPIPVAIRKQILGKLMDAEQFEKFLHTKFKGQKRFSVEGCDTVIPMLDQLVVGAAERGIEHVVLGMAHRGRLTVLATILGKNSERIFTSFEGSVHPDFPADEGDVKYHQGARGNREINGVPIKLTLSSNPSHLEFVDPVVEGMARAEQDALQVEREAARQRVMPVLLHGDAAFIGQGIVMETLNLADLKGYRTGGTIHIVINNQIGFTTTPESGRSSIYSTDVAKITQLPIFHVNADDPEAAWHVLQIALDFRQKFNKDVVIDVIGFRRHGHNEGDEPSYTQPLMYQRVKEHPGVRELYTRQLIREGVITQEEADQMIAARVAQYDAELTAAKAVATQQKGIAKTLHITEDVDGSTVQETGVTQKVIAEVSAAMGVVPSEFTINPKMVGIMSRRAKMGSGEVPIDWAFAEGLAFGSLLTEGTSVRLSGQDCGRGTFSQRHAILYDIHTGTPYVPLEAIGKKHGARFEVFDSSLSEAGVLGFEYGYTLVARDSLILWEAQFGDFANGAQVTMDQFIAPGEDKWKQTSRLVMLLPHGYEGQGPEHSSARLERYLQLCAEDNMQVCYPSTPAQYFHLLRRQVRQPQRKPLVVMTPKSLLRLPQAVSALEQFTSGGFYPVIGDAIAPAAVQRVIICSGKVYYDAMAELEKNNPGNIAILRLEQFYPFPEDLLRRWLLAYPNAKDIVWLQEEPQNMGGWHFVQNRLRELLSADQTLRYAGRVPSASPATGSYATHQLEQQTFLREALG